jgi:hypothetical protein
LLLLLLLLRFPAGTAAVHVRNKRAKDRQLLDAQLGLEGEADVVVILTPFHMLHNML